MYVEGSINKYLDDLAARKPAPGGGSAAALGASIGAALMSMAANFTINNVKYKDCEAKASDILRSSERSRGRLQQLIDEDVEAYSKLSKEMKDPDDDAAKLDALFKAALEAPFEVCKIASECLKLCDELADCGNKNLITDIAIAARMLEGAFFSAKYNVYVNLKYIKDLEYIKKVLDILSPLEEEMPRLKEEILEKCEEVIAK